MQDRGLEYSIAVAAEISGNMKVILSQIKENDCWLMKDSHGFVSFLYRNIGTMHVYYGILDEQTKIGGLFEIDCCKRVAPLMYMEGVKDRDEFLKSIQLTTKNAIENSEGNHTIH